MRRRVKNLMTLVSLVSLAILVPCRPTEEDRFNLIQGEPSVHSLPFSEGSSAPQILESSSPLTFDAIDSALFDSISPTSPNVLSDASIFAQVAPKTICPGKNRYVFCCGAAGCYYTTTCGPDEILCCCTVDPGSPTGDYYDCDPAYPGSQDSLIEPGIEPNSLAEFFAFNDPNSNLVPDDASESFPDDIAESSFWCQFVLLLVKFDSGYIDIDAEEVLLLHWMYPNGSSIRIPAPGSGLNGWFQHLLFKLMVLTYRSTSCVACLEWNGSDEHGRIFLNKRTNLFNRPTLHKPFWSCRLDRGGWLYWPVRRGRDRMVL